MEEPFDVEETKRMTRNTGIQSPTVGSDEDERNCLEENPLFLSKTCPVEINKTEMEIFFTLEYFFKFVCYHIVYFIGGPLVILLIFCIDGYALVHNMGFVGTNVGVFMQYSTFAALTTFNVMYIVFPSKYIQMEHVLAVYAQVLIRTFIIAVKYGYMSPYKIKQLKSKIQTVEFLAEDFLLNIWVEQTPAIIDKTMVGLVWRQQIQLNQWRLKFAQQLTDEFKQQLSKYNYYDEIEFNPSIEKKLLFNEQKLNKKNQKLQDIQLQLLGQSQEEYDVDIVRSYPGRNLLREVIIIADLLQPSLNYINFIFAFRMILYYGLKFAFDYLEDHDFDQFRWCEILFTICEIIILTFLYRYNLLFVGIGVRDFGRKLTMCRIVGSLINPTKNKEYPYFKHFPTLNLADIKTIYAWMNLRVSVLDYGKKFTTRVQFYTSSLIVIYSLLALNYFLQVYFTQTIDLSALKIAIFFDIIVAFVLLLIFIQIGAYINSSSLHDINQLAKIREVIKFIKLNLKKVLVPESYETGLILKIFKNSIIKKHRKLLSKGVPPQKAFQEIQDDINSIDRQYKEIMGKLQHEWMNNPMTFSGIKADLSSLRMIYSVIAVGAASLSTRNITVTYF